MDGGIVAPDFDVFVVFQEFLVPIIKDLHCIDLGSDFHPHPETQFMPTRNREGEEFESSREYISGINLDKTGKYVRECVIECSRNLEQFELPLNLNIGSLEESERVMTAKMLTKEFAAATGEDEIGVYYTMNEVLEKSSEVYAMLLSQRLLVSLLDMTDPYEAAESAAINGKHWPYGRGVYISHSSRVAVWINCQEHLRFMTCASNTSPASIGEVYLRLANAMTILNASIEFRNSYFLGYLAARPSFLGTSLHFTLTLELPHLVKEPDNLLHLCNVRGLHMLSHGDPRCIRVTNIQAMSATEWKIFHDFCTATANVIQLEKDLSMENTKHIAAMLVNIFRKKKNSLGDVSGN